ncbi:uncharacterized protein Dh44 [Centruroides vittatus]|uniref:uncharacterized protein Dh44 n=1 Tax=Centruroides vittatus TaxID=120091 RepID=UPI0035108E51
MYTCIHMFFLVLYILLTPQIIPYAVGDYSKEDINRPKPDLYSVNHVNRLMNIFPRQQIDNRNRGLWALPYPLSNYNGYDLEGTVPPGHMMKRDGPPLSIVNALDVLRQQLMLDMARQKMRENQNKIRQNDEYLKNLGKRSISSQKDVSRSMDGLHRSSYLDKKVLQTSEV